MNIGSFQLSGIPYEMRLGIVFYKNTGKSYSEIADIVGCSRSAAFAVCKKIFNSRAVKNLLRAARIEKFKKVCDGHVTLSVLQSLTRVHNYAFIVS